MFVYMGLGEGTTLPQKLRWDVSPYMMGTGEGTALHQKLRWDVCMFIWAQEKGPPSIRNLGGMYSMYVYGPRRRDRPPTET